MKNTKINGWSISQGDYQSDSSLRDMERRLKKHKARIKVLKIALFVFALSLCFTAILFIFGIT